MPRQTQLHLTRRWSRALCVEPLEDRQLLSGVQMTAGEYASKPGDATGEYAQAGASREYAQAPAAISPYSPTQIHHRTATSKATHPPDQQPGYDTTANPNEHAPPAAAETKTGTADPNQAAPSAGKDPSCVGNTPLALQYARDAASEYAPAAAPESATVLAAAGAIVQRTGREEPDGAGGAAPAADTSPLPAESAVGARAAGPAAAPPLVADAGRPPVHPDLLHAARPVVTDDAVTGVLAVSARSVEPDPGSEEQLESATDLADSQAPGPAPQLASLVAGTAPVDLQALGRRVDQFFRRLEELGEDLPAGPVLLRLAPWVVTVSVATAALELARWQMKKQSPRRSGWIVRPTPDEA